MSSNGKPEWQFFTNHFKILLYVARHPDARLRTIADEVLITERAAHRILGQLIEEGYVTVTKAAKQKFLESSRKIAAMAGAPKADALDAEWKNVTATYASIVK